MNYDLHAHTLHSDGSLTPSQLVARAELAGVDVLAITDHDTVSGVKEAKHAAKTLEVVAGVEISACYQGIDIHIVGLQVDENQALLQQRLAQLRQARDKRNLVIAERLANLGLVEPLKGAAQFAGDEVLGRVHFARYMVAAGMVKDVKVAFSRYLTPGKPAYAPCQWVDMTEAITWIKQAGGYSVLAHPSRYGLKRKRLSQLLKAFKAAGGDGMEVVNSQLSANIIKDLAKLATQYDLMASRGSDFHGPHVPWCQLGRMAEMPIQAKPIWMCWKQAEICIE